MAQKSEVVIELTVPTVFPDLNQKEGKEADFARSNLNISRLKFSHLKKMQTMKEEDQMLFALTNLTGLSESDLDELDAADVAKVMSIVYGFMEDFFKLVNKLSQTGDRK